MELEPRVCYWAANGLTVELGWFPKISVSSVSLRLTEHRTKLTEEFLFLRNMCREQNRNPRLWFFRNRYGWFSTWSSILFAQPYLQHACKCENFADNFTM